MPTRSRLDDDGEWSKRLLWAEEQGLKNLQEKFTTADNINKEAQTTLTYVLTGVGGTFVYVLQSFDKQLNIMIFGAIVLCAYFVILGFFLVWKTFFLKSFPAPFQYPKNLIGAPGLSMDTVRRGELDNIDQRIDEAQLWIKRKSKAINVVRLMLIASPLIFSLAAVLYWIVEIAVLRPTGH